MKNIKLFALVLTFALCLSLLTACFFQESAGEASNQGANDQQVTVPQQVTTPQQVTVPQADTTKPPVEADTSDKGYITSKDTFVNAMKELLDLSLYDELDETDSGSYQLYYYGLNSEYEKDYDLDYTIKTGDGSGFTMPVTFAELEKKGWVLQESSDPDRVIEASFMTYGTIQNAAGKELYVAAYNPSEEPIPFKECTVIQLEASQYSSDDHTEKLDTAIDFTVCDSLTNASTLEDIIKRLGNPYEISCTVWYDSNGDYINSEIEVDYMQESSAYSSIVFELSGDGNYITNMKYDVTPE